MDHFEVLGLARRLVIDEADLQRRFHELSRRYHPDFHQGGSAEEQSLSLETSARINAAYRALRDPIRRVEYLVRLETGGASAQGDDLAADGHAPGSRQGQAPPGLLAEMFEIQEALQEAMGGGLDEAGLAALRDQRAKLEVRYRDEEAQLRGPLARAWDGATGPERGGVLAACAKALSTRAYLRTVIDDLNRALGEEQERHVTHHRH
jgi:molecular chaperone HscB